MRRLSGKCLIGPSGKLLDNPAQSPSLEGVHRAWFLAGSWAEGIAGLSTRAHVKPWETHSLGTQQAFCRAKPQAHLWASDLTTPPPMEGGCSVFPGSSSLLSTTIMSADLNWLISHTVMDSSKKNTFWNSWAIAELRALGKVEYLTPGSQAVNQSGTRLRCSFLYNRFPSIKNVMGDADKKGQIQHDSTCRKYRKESSS